MRAIPIESQFVHELPTTAPPGFSVVRNAFDGLPGEFALSDGWSAILYAPTGIARVWLDTDPDEVASSSREEFLPHVAIAAEAARSAARLVIRRDGILRGALALAAGVMGTFHAPSALLQIVPLSWEIRAGAMRGGVTGGARIDVAWRSRTATGGVVTGAGARASSGGAQASSG